jgi:HTH-type transcriptional regulator / antitoxin HigA
MEMSSATMDMEYGALLQNEQPRVVHDESLNQRFIERIGVLDANFDKLSTGERELYDLLLVLVQHYEKRTYKIRAASPLEVLRELMDGNGLRNKDLVGIFATESIVSEVLSGKRPLTVDHIRKLAERFNVSPAVFI